MFRDRFDNCYLEITSDGNFTEHLKEQLKHDIILPFITRTRLGGHVFPDLVGYVKQQNTQDFITVEVKNEKLSLDNVSQAKMYADLFTAKYGLLLSTDPVPSELKKLHNAVHILNRFVSDNLYLAQCDNLGLIEPTSWFPNDPLGSKKPEHLIEYLTVQKNGSRKLLRIPNIWIHVLLLCLTQVLMMSR